MIVRPGEEPSWCGTCTPRLVKLSVRELVTLKAEEMEWRLREVYELIVDWLIDVL